MSLIDQNCPSTGKDMKHFTAPRILLTLSNDERAGRLYMTLPYNDQEVTQ